MLLSLDIGGWDTEIRGDGAFAVTLGAPAHAFRGGAMWRLWRFGGVAWGRTRQEVRK